MITSKLSKLDNNFDSAQKSTIARKIFDIKKRQIPILIINLIYLLAFSILFLSRKNYEFLMYVGVVILLLLIIILTNKKVDYPNYVLWGLTLWGLMHMAGGGIKVNGDVLYALILVPISKTLSIFRYDQLVHIIGFGVATLVMYVLLKPSLKNLNRKISLAIIIIMAGLGVGALNEIIEFTATLIMPQTGVGGYINNSLDLVSDLIGSIVAYILIRIRNL